jgi:beta-N-acetylhexosaminidase
MYPIPVVYGLTCGELARMITGEGWYNGDLRPEVTVIPMDGWNRDMLWKDTGLDWIPPSPNIPTPATALIYPATCYVEATNLSEGRGTSEPFRLIGAPFVDSGKLVEHLRALNLPGLSIDPVSFVPLSSKQKGLSCNGFRLQVLDPLLFRPVEAGLAILSEVLECYPEQCRVDRSALSRLLGSGTLTRAILENDGGTVDHGLRDTGLEEFRRRAIQYFLY